MAGAESTGEATPGLERGERWLLRPLETVEAEARAAGLEVRVRWTGEGPGRARVVRVRPGEAGGVELLAARFPDFAAEAPRE
ncbi:MAG: hypothetical protein K6U79_01220 [Firmicutes bacterium]|nr:hypothetical protein [Bacillota bacterium]